mgnify:CR=1 FL=1
MTHHMRLHPLPFELIQTGRQKIETWVYDKKRRKIAVGDTIEFSLRTDPEKKFEVKIIELVLRKTFSELFDAYPAEFFGGTNKEELMGIYKYYTKEEETEFGVVGIVLEVV